MNIYGESPLVKINDNDDDDVLPDLPLMVLGKSRVPPRLKDLQRRMRNNLQRRARRNLGMDNKKKSSKENKDWCCSERGG